MILTFLFTFEEVFSVCLYQKYTVLWQLTVDIDYYYNVDNYYYQYIEPK